MIELLHDDAISFVADGSMCFFGRTKARFVLMTVFVRGEEGSEAARTFRGRQKMLLQTIVMKDMRTVDVR